MSLLNRSIGLFSAILLVFLLACSSAPRQEQDSGHLDTRRDGHKSGEVEDEIITGRVKEAILEDPLLKPEEIIVETTHGIVQLSGFVGSIIVMEKAVAAARGVKGVKEVKDAMRLKWQF